MVFSTQVMPIFSMVTLSYLQPQTRALFQKKSLELLNNQINIKARKKFCFPNTETPEFVFLVTSFKVHPLFRSVHSKPHIYFSSSSLAKVTEGQTGQTIGTIQHILILFYFLSTFLLFSTFFSFISRDFSKNN